MPLLVNAEYAAIVRRVVGSGAENEGLSFSAAALPWITERKDLRYLRSVVKEIVAAAEIRDELSFTSFHHGGFTEGADSDLTDAELRAAGRHRSARQLPTYAKRTRKQLISGTKKRREERTKAANLSE
jgi:hypothetical protein